MKKVVNGHVYDVNMAAPVVRWEEISHMAGLTIKVEVKLNRKYVLKEGVAPENAIKVHPWGTSTDYDKIDKTKGEFFLSYEADSWGEESKRIEPITDDQAKNIVEKKCSFETYVKLFGDPRGLVVTPEAVDNAVEQQRSHDYEEIRQAKKERDVAKARVSELENLVRELENR